MKHEIERDWVTSSGLRAVVLVVCYGDRRSHRCGYVGVPKGHPLYGVDYSEPSRVIPVENVESATLGDKSAILAFTAGCRALEGEEIRRSPDVVFDCHGGLTYAGGSGTYPVTGDEWWFGFDCNHYGDANIEPSGKRTFDEWIVRDQQYVEANCERLAKQIAEMKYVVPEVPA